MPQKMTFLLKRVFAIRVKIDKSGNYKNDNYVILIDNLVFI